MHKNAPHEQTILLVEDEKSIRDIYELILSDQGFTVVTAKNGKEALTLAEKFIPSLILLDLMMPVMSGAETIRQLQTKSWGKNIPIIIMTNMGTSEVPKDVIGPKIVDILVKVELSPDQFIEKVKQTLDK